ncbi:MAG: LysR family transcriptional regulator [Myxococcaceae bacterium]|jgi:DNA-binding transcriptional LysR family regulator|nr:LysR family transcriptional regulator [Myxococcaceae bacterium]MCA3011657.1 LysR family transcriptional regulator [Myxococcaceae bacterium]
MVPLDSFGLGLLLVLHRTGSLVAAARVLDVDATTVGRRLTLLERSLRVQLVVRHRGAITLTPAGLEAVRELEQAEVHVARALDRARARHEDVAGEVTVSLGEAMAQRVVAPALPALLERHPRLQLRLEVGAQRREVGRQVDVALLIVPPRGEGLRVRRAGSMAFAFYAARETSAAASLLLFSNEVEERHETALRRKVAAGRRVSVLSASAPTLLACVEAGVGVGLVPCLLGDEVSRLRRVTTFPVIQRTVWSAVHRSEAHIARVRATADWLHALCVAEAARLEGRRRAPASPVKDEVAPREGAR